MFYFCPAAYIVSCISYTQRFHLIDICSVPLPYARLYTEWLIFTQSANCLMIWSVELRSWVWNSDANCTTTYVPQWDDSIFVSYERGSEVFGFGCNTSSFNPFIQEPIRDIPRRTWDWFFARPVQRTVAMAFGTYNARTLCMVVSVLYGCEAGAGIAQSVWRRLLAGRPEFYFCEGREIFLYSTASDSGAHLASYSVGTGGKAAGAWSWPLTSI
jgi:hypothetical protein